MKNAGSDMVTTTIGAVVANLKGTLSKRRIMLNSKNMPINSMTWVAYLWALEERESTT